MTYIDEYHLDLELQTFSGPHEITDERRALNLKTFDLLRCHHNPNDGRSTVLPFADIHKKSDCDLIYRFLIAKKWNVGDTIKGLLEYDVWRREHRLNEILWEKFPTDIVTVISKQYKAFDRLGHPVFFDKINPALLPNLLAKYSQEQLLRVHFRMMEEGRRLCKEYRSDRVTCLLDMSLLSLSLVANKAGIAYLREMARIDQLMYPSIVFISRSK